MGRALRVLIVEDSPDDADLFLLELRRGGYGPESRRVATAKDFIAALEDQEWDAVLCDYTMPGFSGEEALALLRERGGDIPFIFVSGTLSEESAVAAMRAGAHDFVVKDRLKRLVPAVERELRDVEARRARARDRAERDALEAQLHQAQRMEVVGQLTGGLAHDFNNILTVIIGSLDLLLERLADDEEAAEMIRLALDSSLSGAKLTQQLLAFSRRQSLAPRAVGLNDLVSSTLGWLGRTLGEQIVIETSLAEDLQPALADPTQIESAFTNLAINARDAMPNGGHLIIETANKELDSDYAAQNVGVTPGHYVMLAVSDNGSGIAPDILEKVFEPFFTTKELGKGTGLGLSMVYGFAKQSGGHVKIYSEPKRGTTVRLYLPAAETAATQQDTNLCGASDTVVEPVNVLVVEDNPQVRRVAVNHLLALGCRVTEVEDGSSALAQLAEPCDIDLLFTDVVMPGGVSGFDLAQQARKLRPDLKVLFTSGYAESALQGGVSISDNGKLLNKPYRKQELAQKLREVLEDEDRAS